MNSEFIIYSDNGDIVIESSDTKNSECTPSFDLANTSSSELEKYVMRAFSNQGWECFSASERVKISEGRYFSPDITLKKDNKVIGFVECYRLKNDIGLSQRKQEQILLILDQYKPELFILTDGIKFEMYFDCEYVGTMSIPISYHEFSQRKRLSKYYELITKMMETSYEKSSLN